MVAGATVAGLAFGWLVAQRRQTSHRSDLFHDRPSRRFAALGFLAGQPSAETVRLLRDYLGWERDPILRRRAEGMIRRIDARLG